MRWIAYALMGIGAGLSVATAVTGSPSFAVIGVVFVIVGTVIGIWSVR